MPIIIYPKHRHQTKFTSLSHAFKNKLNDLRNSNLLSHDNISTPIKLPSTIILNRSPTKAPNNTRYEKQIRTRKSLAFPADSQIPRKLVAPRHVQAQASIERGHFSPPKSGTPKTANPDDDPLKGPAASRGLTTLTTIARTAGLIVHIVDAEAATARRVLRAFIREL